MVLEAEDGYYNGGAGIGGKGCIREEYTGYLRQGACIGGEDINIGGEM